MATIIDLIIQIFQNYLFFFTANLSLPLAIIAITIGLLVYRFGKKKNLMIMDSTIELFQKEKGDNIAEFKLAETATDGRTYLVELKEGLSLQNIRIHFTMIPRHLVISYVGALIRKRKDYLLIEANPTNNVVYRYQIEIIPLREEKRIKNLVDMLGQLEKITLTSSKYEEKWGVWVNDPDFFRSVFQNKPEIVKNLFSQRTHVVRVSYYPLDSPSIRLVSENIEFVNSVKVMDILFDLTSTIETLGTKKYYTKQKEALRTFQDDKAEEEKAKQKDKRFKI